MDCLHVRSSVRPSVHPSVRPSDIPSVPPSVSQPFYPSVHVDRGDVINPCHHLSSKKMMEVLSIASFLRIDGFLRRTGILLTSHGVPVARELHVISVRHRRPSDKHSQTDTFNLYCIYKNTERWQTGQRLIRWTVEVERLNRLRVIFNICNHYMTILNRTL